MTHQRTIILAIVALTICFFCTQPLSAAITIDPDGVNATDLNPSDPANWNVNTNVYIGQYSSGTVSVVGTEQVATDRTYLGLQAGSNGILRLDGENVSWTCDGNSFVGFYGSGTLEITGGADLICNWNSMISYSAGTTCIATVDGVGSTWTFTQDFLYVGSGGNATLNITNGGAVNCASCCEIGVNGTSTSVVNVNGANSTLDAGYSLCVSEFGNATLNITNGGTVRCYETYLGYEETSYGFAKVDGVGSTWAAEGRFFIGDYWEGVGILQITNGGLVSVGEYMNIDHDADHDSYITMATGGMLALNGGNENYSLNDFLGLIGGTDDIRYWDDATSNWIDITGATLGEDYTIAYHDSGELAGYTVLTVGVVPEPSTILLLATGLIGWFLIRRR